MFLSKSIEYIFKCSSLKNNHFHGKKNTLSTSNFIFLKQALRIFKKSLPNHGILFLKIAITFKYLIEFPVFADKRRGMITINKQ